MYTCRCFYCYCYYLKYLQSNHILCSSLFLCCCCFTTGLCTHLTHHRDTNTKLYLSICFVLLLLFFLNTKKVTGFNVVIVVVFFLMLMSPQNNKQNILLLLSCLSKPVKIGVDLKSQVND